MRSAADNHGKLREFMLLDTQSENNLIINFLRGCEIEGEKMDNLDLLSMQIHIYL